MIAALLTASFATTIDQYPDRRRLHGFVESMPEGLQGTWLIVGRQITTNLQTECDRDEGHLQVDANVNVEIRSGLANEIDTESASNFR